MNKRGRFYFVHFELRICGNGVVRFSLIVCILMGAFIISAKKNPLAIARGFDVALCSRIANIIILY